MVQFYANHELRAALEHNKIRLEDYKPAYCISAGLDLYNAGPDLQYVSHAILIPTGLHLALPPNMVGLILERGSITKTSHIHRAGVVDPGYTGELFVSNYDLDNDLWEYKTWPRYCKLPFQLLVMPMDNQFCSIDREEYDLFTKNSERKTNCLGSSDTIK